MLMPVSTVAMPAGPISMVFCGEGAGAGAERVRCRRGRRGRMRDFMVIVRGSVGSGEDGGSVCAVYEGREVLEGEEYV